MTRFSRAARRLILVAVLICCMYIAWNIPYTHDDWDWGLDVGLERWLSGALNNRYAGTFFVLVMTRSQLLKTLIMGGCMFLLPLFAAQLASNGRAELRFPFFLAATGALFTMPLGTWQQTFGWVSAFSNFVVSCALLLALLLLVRICLSRPDRRWPSLVLCPLALICQLFSENLTLVLAAAALLFAVYAYRAHRATRAALCLLTGALVGLVLMFWNPLYGDLLSTGTAVSGIRHLAIPVGAGIGEMVVVATKRMLAAVLPTLFEASPALWTLVCAGALWRMARSGRPLWLILPAGGFFGLYLWSSWLVVDAIRRGVPWDFPGPLLRQAGGPLFLLFLTLVLWTDRERGRRWLRLALLASSVGLVAPFALVMDFGARCCFVSLVLALILALSLLSDFPWHPWGTAAAALLTAVTLVFHLRVYAVIGGCSALRAELLDAAVAQGAEQVILPTEGWNRAYSWVRNPQSPMRADYFRQFYGLPAELELIFLSPGSYEQWPNISEEMIYYGTKF